MKTRNLLATLAVLLMCTLFLGIGSCNSASDDILGTDGTTVSDDVNVGDDNGTDETNDETEPDTVPASVTNG